MINRQHAIPNAPTVAHAMMAPAKMPTAMSVMTTPMNRQHAIPNAPTAAHATTAHAKMPMAMSAKMKCMSQAVIPNVPATALAWKAFAKMPTATSAKINRQHAIPNVPMAAPVTMVSVKMLPAMLVQNPRHPNVIPHAPAAPFATTMPVFAPMV
jgi:hypothetical protein